MKIGRWFLKLEKTDETVPIPIKADDEKSFPNFKLFKLRKSFGNCCLGFSNNETGFPISLLTEISKNIYRHLHHEEIVQKILDKWWCNTFPYICDYDSRWEKVYYLKKIKQIRNKK